MSSRVNRLVSVLCVLALMVGLVAVPVSAARPMMGAAVEEIPMGETVHAHTHAVSVRLAVDDTEQAELLAAMEECTIDSNGKGSNSNFTVSGSQASKSTGCTVTVNGVSKTFAEKTGLKLQSKAGKVSFAASVGDTITIVATNAKTVTLTTPSKTETLTVTGNIATYAVTQAGSYEISKGDGEGHLYYICVGSNCDHAWSVKSTTAATCTVDGATVSVCSKCNTEKSEPIPATGHTWNAGSVTKEPTCTDPGVKTYTCTVCSAKKTESLDPAHKFGADGVCTVCSQHEHKWDAGSVTTPATCGEEGEKTYQCTVDGCNETDTQPIPATGEHNFKSGVCSVCGARETTGFLAAAGDLETAYALWPIGAGVTKYEAYVAPVGGSYNKVDAQLVREYPGYMRVDALGLKAGKYTIKVVDNTGKEMVTDPLTVKAHERTGFAFVSGTASGAYNDDGTLKTGANVVYITTNDELDALLNSSSIWSGKAETKPTCVRIIGQVKASDVLGFQDWKCGLTVEGVGNDATLTGGGVFVKGSTNVEVRNLAVFHVHSGGKNDLIAIEQKNEHIWVHNCDLFYGFSGGGDQAKGDGSLDVKDTKYSSFSYNHFWDSGKCSLLGNNSNEDYITYHHNWFDHSDSRHPRTRSGNVHIYNNYYDGNSKYGVGCTAGCAPCSIFVEGNYFRNCNDPIMIAGQGTDAKGSGTFSGDPGGMIKAYGNTIVGAKNFITSKDDPTDFDCYVVDNRTDKVPADVKSLKGGNGYSNFDTSTDLGVTAAQIQSPADARATVTMWAGRVQGGDLVWEFNDATDDTSYAVDKDLDAMLTNYKSSLVSIGGTVTKPVSGGSTPAEHTHIAGTWTIVTTPGCDAKTQELVNGQEIKTCTICGEVMETRSVPGAHSNDGSGKCTVCGKAVSNNEGPVSNPNSKILKYNDFTSGSARDPITQAQLDEKYGGYFTLVGTGVTRNASSTKEGASIDHIDLPKSGTSGIKFTVTRGPAEVSVTASSSGKGKSSVLVLKDGSGNPVNNSKGASTTTVKENVSDASTTQFTLAPGTYTLSANAGSENSVRLRQLSVTEPEAPCEHNGTPVHHAAVAATCGEEGNIEYWTCTDVCKKNFSDAAMTKVVTNVTTEPTGKHTWSEWSEPDEDGEQSRFCEVCDEEETKGGTVTPPTPPVEVVDTKGLEAAIAAAEKMTTVKVDTAAANVDKGVSWVTKSVMDALKAAIATAKALDTTKADQAAVDAAAKTLNDAVDTFVAAVQEGTKESSGTATAHTFESKTLTEAGAGSAASGAYKDDSYFTLVPTNKTKYDQSSKQWGESFGDNAYDPSGDNAASKVIRFNMGGATTKDGPGIKFTTASDNATVQIWWVQGGGDTEQKDSAGNKNGEFKDVGIRQIAVVKASDASKVAASDLAHTSATPSGTDAGRIKANDPEYTELTIPTAGDYMVGSLDGSNYIFKIVVTEGGSATPTVDKSALNKAIDDAVAAIAVPTVSKDGKDVAPTAKWVTQAEKDTFQAAITAAKAAKLTAASAADVTAAVKTLTDAQAAFVAAQENGTLGSAVAVTGVKLDKTTLTLVLNGTKTDTLTATVSPSNASTKAVTWKSSNDTVATVDQTGKVTAVAEGSATITVTTADGGKTATCAVTVKATGSGGNGGGGGGGGISAPSTPSTPSTPATKLPFVDVAENVWYHDTVEKAYNMGLMKGTDATHFTPNQNTSRAMIATILYRLDGEKKTNVKTAFDDVAAGQWYTEAIEWAANAGVVKGYDEDTFAPDDNITREQLAVMLYRYADPGNKRIAGDATLSDFVDAASVSEWATQAMEWCVKCGIITGKGLNNLDPKGLASRAEAVTMLMRFVELGK